MYIFDRDDIGVLVADQMKRRSDEVDVRVVWTAWALSRRHGSSRYAHAGGLHPSGFDLRYLETGSKVQVRVFLNPWYSTDHSKVLLVDGQRAWLGG